MKTYCILTAILCAIMVFAPLTAMVVKNETETNIGTESEPSDFSSDNTANGETIRVMRTDSKKVIDIELYDYVVGTVAAEIPASFSSEAIKAQAVACYSYALWVKNNADNNENYDISDDSGEHQSYMDYNQLKEKWGEKYDKNIKIIKDAVNSVLGEYLVYKNEPALCVYHAISGGNTQSAKQAWGNETPYLISVTAPGDTLSPDYDSELCLSGKEVKNKLNSADNEKITIETDTGEGEYVKKVTVNSNTYSGVEFSALLGIKSPCFTVEKSDEGYIFKVKGKGHGIGMSQYSADYMARQGSTYKEILLHFYPGTTLVSAN